MSYTVGVPAYNEERGIERIMDFLISQHVPEIIVYNDGSTDRTLDRLQRFRNYPNVRIIGAEKNRGYSAALNAIVASSSNPIVVIVDADSLPQSGSILKLVKPFSNPKVGGTSGTHKMRFSSKRSIVSCINERIYKTKAKIDYQEFISGDYIHLNGLLFAVRKDVVVNDLVENANQDAYLGWLIQSKGYYNVFVDDSISVFQPPMTVRDYLYSRWRVIMGHVTLSYRFGIHKYLWHECSFKDYARAILTSVPVYSIRGIMSLIFGVIADSAIRLYWFRELRVHPEKYDSYHWKQIESTKW